MVSPVPLIDYSHPRKEFFFSQRISPHWQDERIRVWNPRWFYPPFGTPINSAALFLRILPQVLLWHRERPFDLIDAHFGFPEGIAAAILAKALRIPFVITLRGHEPLVARRAGSRSCLSWAMRSARQVISVSDELTAFAVAHGVEATRAITISNGVDSQVFYHRPENDVRKQLGILFNAPLILCVGYLVPRKGHQRVIQAVGKLHRENPDQNIHLVIVGGESTHPGFSEELRREVGDTGLGENAHFAGAQSPSVVAEMMNAADVFCLASDWEGCPNVVVEALACGVPVVTSNVGQNPYLIQSGVNGFLFSLDDPEALAGLLKRALGHNWDRRSISENGQRRTWEIVADEVSQILQEVTGSD